MIDGANQHVLLQNEFGDMKTYGKKRSRIIWLKLSHTWGALQSTEGQITFHPLRLGFPLWWSEDLWTLLLNKNLSMKHSCSPRAPRWRSQDHAPRSIVWTPAWSHPPFHHGACKTHRRVDLMRDCKGVGTQGWKGDPRPWCCSKVQ